MDKRLKYYESAHVIRVFRFMKIQFSKNNTIYVTLSCTKTQNRNCIVLRFSTKY